MESLTNLINRIGMPRLAAMAVVAVLMLGFFGFLIMRAQTPQMAPLYSGLSLEDSSAIITELQTLNVPYDLRGEGDTILIPRDQITTTRMTLAGQGLPQRGQVGYEIFDQQSTLGATSFVQNINNVRALEGELARTIASLTASRARASIWFCPNANCSAASARSQRLPSCCPCAGHCRVAKSAPFNIWWPPPSKG